MSEYPKSKPDAVGWWVAIANDSETIRYVEDPHNPSYCFAPIDWYPAYLIGWQSEREQHNLPCSNDGDKAFQQRSEDLLKFDAAMMRQREEYSALEKVCAEHEQTIERLEKQLKDLRETAWAALDIVHALYQKGGA